MEAIVIAGAGECGVRAAFALREAGFAGSVTLIGEELHLPYERPPLSKHYPAEARAIATAGAFRDAGIALMRGRRVTAIDLGRKAVETDDGCVSYDKLLIATGARARRFSGMETVLTLRTLDDAQAIVARLAPEKHLAVIGGGFIGLELAATARRLGSKVTVIEAGERLMARAVPPEVAAAAERRHRGEGVDILLGAEVREAEQDGVTLADGRRIACDVVVAGVGAVPNTGLAEAAGLTVENGIVVDACFRTSAAGIYAAGDCCAFPYRGGRVRLESWRAAQDQGRHVARAMIGREESYGKIPWFWSDQYDLCLQATGLCEAGRERVRRTVGEDGFVLFEIDEQGTLAAAAGIGRGTAVAKDIRLAEMMIERSIAPDGRRLADPSVSLKTMLKG